MKATPTALEYRAEQDKKYNRLFIILSAILLCCAAVWILATNGSALYTYLFWNRSDTFMDYFNSVVNASVADPYIDAGVIYPPFMELVYRSFAQLTPLEIFTEGIPDPTVAAQPPSIKVIQGYVFPFIIYTVILVSLLCLTIYESRKNTKPNKLYTVFYILFSAPVLWAFERGNNILFAVIGLMLFFMWYDFQAAGPSGSLGWYALP